DVVGAGGAQDAVDPALELGLRPVRDSLLDFGGQCREPTAELSQQGAPQSLELTTGLTSGFELLGGGHDILLDPSGEGPDEDLLPLLRLQLDDLQDIPNDDGASRAVQYLQQQVPDSCGQG